MRLRPAILFLSTLLSAGTVWSQGPTRVGDQFQVNTYTTNIQANPSVAADGQNNFVVVWHSFGSYGSDTNASSIQAQRFNADRTPAGGQLQVNSFTESAQVYSRVAVAPQGDFVVVWESLRSASESDRSSQAMRFDASGAAVGSQFQVNTYTTYAQNQAAVATDDQGNFVVVWRSNGSFGTDLGLSTSIQARQYTSGGVPLGVEFQVNSFTTGYQYNPTVGFDGAGNFVVVWDSDQSAGTDTSKTSIQAQRFSANGTPAGGQFQVNSHTTGDQAYPAIGVDSDGEFVVAWQSDGSAGSDTSGYSILAQRYDAAGNKVGGEFQVNSYTTNNQVQPSVSADSTGDFVVVWTSYGSNDDDTSATSVQGQMFSASGAPLLGEFQVNTYTVSYQAFPSVVLRPDGDFIVVWHSAGGDGTDSGANGRESIQGQVLSILFHDELESGDTSAWSTTVP